MGKYHDVGCEASITGRVTLPPYYNDVDRRNPSLMEGAKDLWNKVSNGTLSPSDAQGTILGRGIIAPDWHTDPTPTTTEWSLAGP
jgi:hypothetical protein